MKLTQRQNFIGCMWVLATLAGLIGSCLLGGVGGGLVSLSGSLFIAALFEILDPSEEKAK